MPSSLVQSEMSLEAVLGSKVKVHVALKHYQVTTHQGRERCRGRRGREGGREGGRRERGRGEGGERGEDRGKRGRL